MSNAVSKHLVAAFRPIPSGVKRFRVVAPGMPFLYYRTRAEAHRHAVRLGGQIIVLPAGDSRWPC